MRLTHLRVKNFQSFGAVTDVTFDDLTFLLGPNGAGKTATLQALCRLFSTTRRLRDVRASDFHVNANDEVAADLLIEATFDFPECREADNEAAAVPDHYEHMLLESADGVPRVRFRLTATLVGGEVEDETFVFVTECNEFGEPTDTTKIPGHQRHRVQLHYIPAGRDPSEQVSFTEGTMLGRLMRSASWEQQKEQITDLAQQMNEALFTENESIEEIATVITEEWSKLHKGRYFSSPSLSLPGTDLDSVLRNLSLTFSPAHGQKSIDFTKLSDGQRSLLYLTLIISMQRMGRRVANSESKSFDVSKLRPPSFSLIVVEEPENSLSPYYLGRIARSLQDHVGNDSQAVVATHSPAMLKRVSPSKVRYLRLNESRETTVKEILLPENDADALKYVREAVEAFPEVYFARLVVLGEGDSEEIVLPRLLQAAASQVDEAAVVVAPLGGRHVNHFWRLLTGLEIPFVTLLDLDLGRHQGGWGRIRTTLKQLAATRPGLGLTPEFIESKPRWDSEISPVESQEGTRALEWLATQDVFFSSPLDLDFSMLTAFRSKFDSSEPDGEPDEATTVAVLGKSHAHLDMYDDTQKSRFSAYHRIFKLGSKPTAHLAALGSLTDEEVDADAPLELRALAERVVSRLSELPE